MKNIAFIFAIAGLVSAQIIVSPSSIKADVSSLNYEESPLVPIVFFDSGSDIVESRYDAMLREIVIRLADNPDVAIEIRGFYHRAGDGSAGNDILAKSRAEAVKKKIIGFDKTIERRVLVEPSQDPTALRRGDHGSLDIKTQQENQRAEITVHRLDEFVTTFAEFDAKKIANELDESGKLYRMQRLLSDNPMMFIIIEGVMPGSEKKPDALFDELNNIRNEIVKKLDAPQVLQRIFIAPYWTPAKQETIYGSGDTLWKDIFSQTDRVRIFVSGDWLARKPFEQMTAQGSCDPQSIKISTSGARIFSEDGTNIATISSDWNLSSMPNPMRTYFASTIESKQSGLLERKWSEPIIFKNGKNPKKLSEWMIIADYKWNQIDITAHASASARRDFVVRHISDVAKANSGKNIKITIAGYIDHTGENEKNRQMSLSWAKLEFDSFLRALSGYMDKKPSQWDSPAKIGNTEISYISAENQDRAGGKYKANENNPEERVGKRRVEVFVEY